MRVKHKKWAEPLLAAHPEKMALDAAQFKGHWQERFEKVQPLHLEVGMGKGQFIIGMAKAHPEINFIGLEIESTVAAIALKKALPEKLPNLQMIRADGAGLETFFTDGSIERIYLNFSDPWPKARHAKRRLTSTAYWERYDGILKEDGTVEFKTDNRELFDFSLEQVVEAGWEVKACTFDLHNDEKMNQNNIMTEYEEKFSSKGNPICKLIAERKR